MFFFFKIVSLKNVRRVFEICKTYLKKMFKTSIKQMSTCIKNMFHVYTKIYNIHWKGKGGDNDLVFSRVARRGWRGRHGSLFPKHFATPPGGRRKSAVPINRVNIYPVKSSQGVSSEMLESIRISVTCPWWCLVVSLGNCLLGISRSK